MAETPRLLPLAVLTAALLAAPAFFTGVPPASANRATDIGAPLLIGDDTPQPQETTIDDDDIDAFAEAAVDVHRVRLRWMPELQAAARQGPEAQMETEQQAMEEMAAVVEQHGLTIDKYNAIVDLAESDPLIQDRIAQKLQQSEQLSQQPGDDMDDDQDDPDDTGTTTPPQE